ncbi:MAG: beta-ketoacyl-ACP synthase III [Rhodospirillales bacterium]|jgi:3-oxoacyl-[acyl-carrier-protein] synthase-3|nr:3-oxoacyl-ACP synthase [Rhodospirillaceae bacterium]MDP6428237.1 beta-ketoacyl-ACP synthase III [Rhodospirillales bacterium]MDP6646035.1 beta-ketoacyl-ACP synthase III [Rhodospirillales bacterium]MDP6842800.1 beta-ketoacyl-ACP synthase III [Rhodospirillales bacterium]|tara:strand:- start:1416 stop:2393 length:978 start_codon:yes stop_codon:yes gene_type:complete
MGSRSRIIGCGSYLPEKILTNDELAIAVDTSDEWITARTGIKRRHIAGEGEFTSDLAHQASIRALENAGIKATDLDLIIVGTTTPDETFPATAVTLQGRLGLQGGAAFDVQAVCSGFIYGLSIVDSMLRSGQVETALVVGAETMSRILDWEDRATCVLFGDGAGAVVIKAENGVAETTETPGILSTHIHSDGQLRDLLYCDGGPSTTGNAGVVKMMGKEVYKHAVTNLTDVVVEALAANSLQPEDIDWLVPHQANRRIIDSTIKKLGLAEDKVVMTIADHANTSAASIPLALDAALSDGRIQSGDLILMEAMGGGLTWGAAIVRW